MSSKSNKDLAREASELSAILGESVTTNGLNNQQLVELVDDLQLRVDEKEAGESAEDEAEADSHEEPELAAVVPAAPTVVARVATPKSGVSKLVIADGKAITSPRGILRQGEEVRSEDFDAATISRLVSLGCVYKSE